MLIAAHDTLPHISNLHLWKKKPNPSYPLCGHQKQTLLHVLNNCNTALHHRRYICLLVHLFVCLFIFSFVHLFTCSFIWFFHHFLVLPPCHLFTILPTFFLSFPLPSIHYSSYILSVLPSFSHSFLPYSLSSFLTSFTPYFILSFLTFILPSIILLYCPCFSLFLPSFQLPPF